MPELPFLAVLAENLAAQAAGRAIEGVRIPGASVLKTVDPPIGEVRGTRIAGVRRRGKYLLLDLAMPAAGRTAPPVAGGAAPAPVPAGSPRRDVRGPGLPRGDETPPPGAPARGGDRPALVLVMHLRRHGRLQLGAGRSAPRSGRDARPSRGTLRDGRDTAFVLSLDDGRTLRLIEMGPKKAASVWLVRAGEEAAGPLAGLGVEPLSDGLTADALAAMLAGERLRLKPFLTTQRHVAGIGNAYADEILWEARLSPQMPAAALGRDEVERLRAAIVSALERGVAAHRGEPGGALPMREPLDALAVHRHGKEPCPRCKTPIAVIYYRDRETYYCPACQTAGKVYADRRRSRLLR